VSSIGLGGEGLDVDDSGFPHYIVIAIHKPARPCGLGKCPGNAVVGDLVEKREFLKGWCWRRIIRCVDHYGEIIALVLTDARAPISVAHIAIIALLKFIHHAISACSKSSPMDWRH